ANVYLGRELRRGIGPLRILDYAAMYKRAGQLFAELKSETRPRDLVKQMSGGQRQAVAIARLLLTKPKIVFLDEPSGSMDLASERQLIKQLKVAFDRNTTLIVSTHRYSMLELVDRLIVIEQGRVVADGAKEQVIQALQKANA
ncbi:MAG: ATP-binding cassette domain-containing protein, partial [Mesorhizobium sp.]